MIDNCKKCFYYNECLNDFSSFHQCEIRDYFLFIPNCNNCKHFNYVQAAKYFGLPCDLHGNAYIRKCEDYTESE